MSYVMNHSDAESSDMSMELDILFQKKKQEKEEQEKRQIEEIKEIQKNIDQQQILKEIDKINISYDQIHIFHLKQKGLYNEEEEEIKKKQKFQSIKEIKVKDISELPIEMNIQDQMKKLFEDQILRDWENKQQFERFKKACTIPAIFELNKWIFWMILFVKYPTTYSSQKVFDALKELISQEYTLLNTLIPKPKEEFLNPILFVMIYISHKMMFELFFQDRKTFNMRFILDCYHLVQYEINGVLTTDFYIQQTIDKYFSVRFLEYEKATKFTEIQKKKKMMERGREFLGHYLDIPMPQTVDQISFYSDVKRILSLGKKNQQGNKGGRLQMIRNFSNSRSSNNTSLMESDSSTIKKHRKSSLLGKSPNKLANRGSIYSNNSHSLNNITGQQNEDIIGELKKGRKKDKNNKYQKGQDIYENISPSLRIKNSGRDIAYARLRFNLNQVSPTISKQIELKDCTLQDKRKQVIFHPIDRFIKSKDFVQEVEQMKQESLNRQKQIEIKVREQFNIQLINSEQMRLKVLKGNQDMPSMDVITSHSDLSSQDSSLQFAKEIMKLKLIPKKKDDELQQLAQRHKMQYEQVKQIKLLIDEQGTKVSDLPSTIQITKKKNSDELEEEEDQRQKILTRLYQQNQYIQKQTSLISKEQEQIQSHFYKQQTLNQNQQSQPQISLKQIANSKQELLNQTSLSLQPQQLQKVKSIKVTFDSLKKQPSIFQSQKLIPRSNDQSPSQSNQKSQFSNLNQNISNNSLKPSSSGFITDSVIGSKDKSVSHFQKQQFNRSVNKTQQYEDSYQQLQQAKIKFLIEEKQKLDSSVQFLVLEQDEDLIEIDKKKRFSSISPRNNQQSQLKIVRPKEYKDKYKNINYLIESIEDKQLLKEKKRFGIKDN